MGMQVNFYMSPEDEAEFLEYLRTQDGVRILKDWTDSPHPRELGRLPEPGTHSWFQVWLHNREISPAPALLFVEKQDRYCMDAFAEEVIEFNRSIMRDGYLTRGRLWAEFAGWDRSDPHVTIKKSEAFRRWFNRLSGWIKRRATRNVLGDYVMPGASEFAAGGGKLVQAAFADGSTVDG